MRKLKALISALSAISLLLISFFSISSFTEGNSGGRVVDLTDVGVHYAEHSFIEKGFDVFEREFDESVKAGEAPQVERDRSSIAPPENEAAGRATDTMEKIRNSDMMHMVINLSETASEMDEKHLLDDMIFGYDRGIVFGFEDKEELEAKTVAADARDPLAVDKPLGVEPDENAPEHIVHEYEDIEFDKRVAEALEAATKKEFEVAKQFGEEISVMAEARLKAEIGLDAFEQDNQLLEIDHRHHFFPQEEEHIGGKFQADAGDPKQANQRIGAPDPSQTPLTPGEPKFDIPKSNRTK